MTRLTPAPQVLNQQLRDPAFREQWERTALARAFATWLIKYRIEHGLSQRHLAERLGLHQSAVSRLEAGDHAVRFETVQRIVTLLNETLMITITPGRTEFHAGPGTTSDAGPAFVQELEDQRP